MDTKPYHVKFKGGSGLNNMRKVSTKIFAILLIAVLAVSNTALSLAEGDLNQQNVTGGTIAVSDEVAANGDIAEVTISLVNNPGIASMKLNVCFDSSALKLVGVQDKGKLGATVHSDQLINPYVLSWANDTATKNITFSGDIVMLQFEVAEGIEVGTVIPIEVNYDLDNYDICNVDLQKVEFATENGSITVGNKESEEPKQNSIDEFIYSVSGNEMTIIGYTGDATEVNIGSYYTVDGVKYTVVAIAMEAFLENETITKVVIPETVKTIGEAAFYDCTSLTEVVVLSRDAVIEDVAFGYYYASRKEQIVDGFTIYGYEGSTAQSYAETSDEITFVVLQDEPEEKPDDEVETISKARLRIFGANFKVNNGVTQTIYNYVQEFNVGESITLTATGENFAYWMNDDNKIISTSANYTFNLWQDTTITVVYKNAIVNETAFVEFVSDYGQVIQAQNYAATSDITLPSGPSKLGYSFTGWNMSVSDIQEAIAEGETYIRVTPLYEKLTGTFQVEVIYDNDNVNADVHQNVTGYEFMSLTAKDIEGRKFAYWSDAATDGNVLGTSETYYLYVNNNVTIYAIYVDMDVELETTPVSTITNSYASNVSEIRKVHFEVSREIPDGYILQEHGALYGTSLAFGEVDAMDNMVIDNPDVKKSISTSAADQGIYVLSVNVGAKVDTVVYARGYMILQNETTGETVTVYSQIVSGSYNSLKVVTNDEEPVYGAPY